MSEFEDVNLYDESKPLDINVLERLRRELDLTPEERPIPSATPYYVAATAAVASMGLLAYKKLRSKEREKEEMTTEEVEDMALHKDMIDVQYGNRVSAGRDFFTSSNERRAIPETTLKDNRKLDVGDYKFVEGSDLYALFENEKINKRVLAIRGLRPDIDKKDLLQAPRMGAQTILKMNLDTDAQYKKDYEDIEDYLLNLPNYKDVTITGHSRGGQTGLELARKHKLKAHVFQPVTVRGIEETDSRLNMVSMKDTSLIDESPITLKINKRNIYTNNEDTTPSNLVDPTSTSETHYVIDYDSSLHINPIFKTFNAHKLNNFNKDAVGYRRAKRDNSLDYPINRLTEQEARDLGYDMDDDGMYDDDIEEIEYPIQAFSERAFVPNNTFIRDKIENEVVPTMSLDMLDADGDGIVTYIEFVRYWSKRGYSIIRIKEMFAKLDLNNDSVLTSNEFN